MILVDVAMRKRSCQYCTDPIVKDSVYINITVRNKSESYHLNCFNNYANTKYIETRDYISYLNKEK